MRKYIFSLVALFFLAQTITANVVTGVAAIPEGYYNGVDTKKSADAILDALFDKIKNHNVISYNALEDYYEQTDFRGDSVWDMYSTCRFTMVEANKTQKAVCDGWNKEHSIPQSWFNEASPMKSDLFHVYPTDARVNNSRSNNPYGEVAGKNGTGITKDPYNHALGKSGSNTFAGYTGTVFEPDDEYKGDFARTYFYMCARYRDKILTASSGSVVFTSNKTNLTTYAKNLFLKWHRQDPVSQKEIDRNQAVYGIQKNRNPFIDYPELAEYIWGNKVGQAVDLASMTPTCEGGVLPPITDTKYGVTWSVNGTILRVDSVKANSKPAALPDTPTSCSETSETFVGWSAYAINGTTDTKPADLFVSLEEAPAIIADITFYAVFAHVEKNQGQGSVTEVNDLSTYKRGNKVSSLEVGEVNVTFAKAGASNDATYYTELRCYAKSTITFSGATMTKIEFEVGKEDKSNELRPNVGKMANNAVWEGSADNVVFTVGGESGYRGIGAISVTYSEGQTIITSYSAFLTSCGKQDEPGDEPGDKSGDEPGDEPGDQAINEYTITPDVHKVLIDGRMYILVGETLYNVMGQKVND